MHAWGPQVRRGSSWAVSPQFQAYSASVTSRLSSSNACGTSSAALLSSLCARSRIVRTSGVYLCCKSVSDF